MNYDFRALLPGYDCRLIGERKESYYKYKYDPESILKSLDDLEPNIREKYLEYISEIFDMTQHNTT